MGATILAVGGLLSAAALTAGCSRLAGAIMLVANLLCLLASAARCKAPRKMRYSRAMSKPWVPRNRPARPWWHNTVILPRVGDPRIEVFFYTIDRSRRGGPEFLVFGEDLMLNATLNSLCARWDEEGGLPLGEDLHGHYDAPVRLLECPATVHARHTGQASRLACAEGRPEPRVLQVVIADEAGRWPWEPGCTRPQTVLGDVTPPPPTGSAPCAAALC